MAERYQAIRAFIEERPEALLPVTREITLAGKPASAADAFVAQYRPRELGRRCDTARGRGWTPSSRPPRRRIPPSRLGFFANDKKGRYFDSTGTFTDRRCNAGEAFVSNGCYAGCAPVPAAFRHLILGLSRRIAGSPLTWACRPSSRARTASTSSRATG